MPIKRKSAKRKTKRINPCLPCNPSRPGVRMMRRRNPDGFYYVYLDITNPQMQPSEHMSFEEARKVVNDLRIKGFSNARIVGPGCMPEDDDYR